MLLLSSCRFVPAARFSCKVKVMVNMFVKLVDIRVKSVNPQLARCQLANTIANGEGDSVPMFALLLTRKENFTNVGRAFSMKLIKSPLAGEQIQTPARHGYVRRETTVRQGPAFVPGYKRYCNNNEIHSSFITLPTISTSCMMTIFECALKSCTQVCLCCLPARGT